MNPFEMVVLIVAITAIAKVFTAKYRQAPRDAAPAPEDADAARMRDEIRTLKDRIAVLERIATDNNRSLELDREIERLRDRH